MSALTSPALWVVPPAVLAWSLAVPGHADLRLWSAVVVGVSVIIWATFTRRMGAPVWYGLLYPLGALVGLVIFLRAWARGRRVEWKGRTYVLDESTMGG